MGKLINVESYNGINDPDAANVNPFRYRSYYYDVETGFYYLQSRYYDPVTGRFVNADGYACTG
ncbi:MAG: RHS repeat-associated core domain-containing protein [Acutalibacteraceae bacterium]